MVDVAFVAATQVQARQMDAEARRLRKNAEDAHLLWDSPLEYRVAVVGDACVGKTWFCNQLSGKELREYEPTLTEEPVETAITIFCGEIPIVLRFIDWAWDQTYQIKNVDVSRHFASVDASIFMFSYADPATLKNLIFRFAEFDRVKASKLSLIVGNKNDLKKLRVTDTEAWAVAIKRGPSAQFVSTSAKSRDGLNDALKALLDLFQVPPSSQGEGDVCVRSGIAEEWARQARRAQRVQEILSENAVGDLAELVAGPLGVDELSTPQQIVKAAAEYGIVKAAESDPVETILARAAVILEEREEENAEDVVADIQADKERAIPKTKKLGSPKTEGGIGPPTNKKVIEETDAAEENRKRAERMRAKATERRAREEREEKQRILEEEAKHQALLAAKLQAKAKADAKARMKAEQARLRRFAAQGPVHVADLAMSAAGRATATAAQSSLMAKDAAVRAVEARLGFHLQLVSESWPCTFVHFYENKTTSLSLKLTLPENWRLKKKSTQELLCLVVEKINRRLLSQQKQRSSSSAAATTTTPSKKTKKRFRFKPLSKTKSRFESIDGTPVDYRLPAYDAIARAGGCLYVRRQKKINATSMGPLTA